MPERPPADSDDDALMGRYAGGEVAAFDTLYQRYKGPLYRFLLHQCGDRGLAEDLVQDVFATVLGQATEYRASGRFQSWLYRIARNRLTDRWRQAGRQPQATLIEDCGQLGDEAPGPDGWTHAHGLAGRFRQALQELPPAQREAFVLREETGLSLEEIARVTGVDRETAKSRLRYAVGRLRRALSEVER